MSEVQDLIIEAKDLLASIEADVKRFAAVEPDATQLRIATSRLRLFTEQHAQAVANVVQVDEPEPVTEPVAEETDEKAAAKPRRAKAAAKTEE